VAPLNATSLCLQATSQDLVPLFTFRSDLQISDRLTLYWRVPRSNT